MFRLTQTKLKVVHCSPPDKLQAKIGPNFCAEQGQMERTIRRWNFQLFRLNGTTDPQLFAVRLYMQIISHYIDRAHYMSEGKLSFKYSTHNTQSHLQQCLQQKNHLLQTRFSILNCGLAMCLLATILPRRLMSLLLNPVYKRKPSQCWEIWVLLSLERQHWVSVEIWSLL